MAFPLSGRILDREGAGVSGVQVRAFALLNDGNLDSPHEAETTSDGDGIWAFAALDPANSESGMFVVEQFQSSSGDTRYIYPDVALQIESLVGPDGAAPLAADSVIESHIEDGAVTANKIGTGAVTEGKIGTGAVTEDKIGTDAVTKEKLGDITANDSLTAASGAQNLHDAVSMLSNMVKRITGEPTWHGTPDATLAGLAAGAGGDGVAAELDLPNSNSGYLVSSSSSDISITATSASSPTGLGPSVTLGAAGSVYLVIAQATIGRSTSSGSESQIAVGLRLGGSAMVDYVTLEIEPNNNAAKPVTFFAVFTASGATALSLTAWRPSGTSETIKSFGSSLSPASLVALRIS